MSEGTLESTTSRVLRWRCCWCGTGFSGGDNLASDGVSDDNYSCRPADLVHVDPTEAEVAKGPGSRPAKGSRLAQERYAFVRFLPSSQSSLAPNDSLPHRRPEIIAPNDSFPLRRPEIIAPNQPQAKTPIQIIELNDFCRSEAQESLRTMIWRVSPILNLLGRMIRRVLSSTVIQLTLPRACPQSPRQSSQRPPKVITSDEVASLLSTMDRC